MKRRNSSGNQRIWENYFEAAKFGSSLGNGDNCRLPSGFARKKWNLFMHVLKQTSKKTKQPQKPQINQRNQPSKTPRAHTSHTLQGFWNCKHLQE